MREERQEDEEGEDKQRQEEGAAGCVSKAQEVCCQLATSIQRQHHNQFDASTHNQLLIKKAKA